MYLGFEKALRTRKALFYAIYAINIKSRSVLFCLYEWKMSKFKAFCQFYCIFITAAKIPLHS